MTEESRPGLSFQRRKEEKESGSIVCLSIKGFSGLLRKGTHL